VLLGGVAVIDNRLKTFSIGRAQIDDDTGAHAQNSHTGPPSGIPNPDSPDRINPLGVWSRNEVVRVDFED
jgi:hypothetical protein